MKAHILSSLWSVDSLYLGSTKDFFVFRTYSDASDFRSFLELAKIYQYTNEIQKAFESIKNAINILSPMPEIEVDELKLLGFGIDELISSIYYIEYYNKFRQISPLAISYSLDKDVYKLSWICFLVTFKDMFETFYKYSKQENQLITSDINDEATLSLLSIFQKSYLNVYKDIIKISNTIALINRETSNENKIQIVENLMIAFPELILVEFSRLNGYLSDLFNIDKNDLNYVKDITSDEINDRIYQAAINIFNTIEQEFRITNTI
jgi:hypothetical protein